MLRNVLVSQGDGLGNLSGMGRHPSQREQHVQKERERTWCDQGIVMVQLDLSMKKRWAMKLGWAAGTGWGLPG